MSLTQDQDLQLPPCCRELVQLRERNVTQETTIRELWAINAAAKKRNEHAQAYIPKLKERIANLEAQMTNEAKAERYFKDEK